MRRSALILLTLAACSPPPAVQAVDAWLTAYANDDTKTMIANTWSGDQVVLEQALAELRTVATGTLAIALPPRPLKHELVEVESKSDDGVRWVVLVHTTLKNPLPFAAEKVGHALENMPKTRDQRRKLLVIKEGDRWGVKLDLAKTVARTEFSLRFQSALDRRDFATAEKMLAQVPPPPDEASALKKSDRLTDTFRAELEKAKKRAAGGK